MSQIHNLKLASTYYKASECGNKTFEIRKNDRNFQVGDIIVLNEYNGNKSTGRNHRKIITYILDNEEYLQPNYVCLGVRLLSKTK